MASRKRKRVFLWTAVGIAAVVALNWAYQVLRKPSELLAPVGSMKTPGQTWRQYEAIFRKYSTPVITPELLAALAQVEAAGNPVATTAWRLRVTADPRQVYRPASSAVGLFQLTDGTFAEAKRYCVREHAVREDCWFNALYTRVLPRHAVELTSAYLDRRVAAILAGRRMAATLAQKQELAAVIHLCGASAGDIYAARGFRLKPGQRCGEHDPRAYLERVATMKRLFARLKALG